MRREAAREYLRSSLWVLPTLAVVLALIAGSVLSQVKVAPDSPLVPMLFQGTADDARGLLVTISSTMVTVIALVLGLTVVALQLASTQFSPRLLRNFLRDRVTRLTLSSFVATFAYSTAGLFTVGVESGRRVDEYPRLAVSGALLLIFVSMVALVFFVHHLAHSIQIDQVTADVERTTLQVVRQGMGESGETAPVPPVPAGASALPARGSGYVQTFHFERLVEVASRVGAVVAVVPMMGEHLVAGAPVARAWPSSPGAGPLSEADLAQLRDAVAHDIRVGFERTAEQDAAFGVRQLADIASKALSPAINDPYTAVQAVDHLSVVLAQLANALLGPQVHRDGDGAARVHVPGRDWEYFVDLGLGQVRRFGHTEPRVVLALLRVTRDIAYFCTDDRRDTLRRYLEVLRDDVARDVRQAADRDPLLARCEALIADLSQPSAAGPRG